MTSPRIFFVVFTLFTLFTLTPLTPVVRAEITGHWSFEAADLFLSAKIGQPMIEADNDTGLNEEFGTTGQGTFASVPNIGGQAVKILKFPKTSPTGGYYVPPGTPANGGGAKINQYTLLVDLLYPAASSGKLRALFQTDGGGGDAEFFVNAANQLSNGGSVVGGSLAPDAWHRVAIAVDLAATPPSVAFFIDGTKVTEGDPGAGLDGRFALLPPDLVTFSSLYFVNDDTGDTESGYVNCVQIRNERVPDAVIAALGGATPGGIPTGPLPDPYLLSATPSPESARIPERSTVSPRPLIQAVLVDGTNAVDVNMVSLLLNGAIVGATAMKAGANTTVSFTPAGYLPALSTNSVQVNYKGMDGTAYSNRWQFVVGRYQSLAAGAAGPPGSGNTPGLVARTVQAPADTGILNLNSLPRAIQQLNGTLVDTGGVLVANVAIAGPNGNGSYDVDQINYHLDGTGYGVFANDVLFPGVPGLDGGMANFSSDVLTFLDLPAGVHRLGVSVSTDRTDTETDDGYAIFSGSDARNVLAPIVGSFFRGSVPAFSASFTTNEFTIVVPSAGIYSFRLVFYQTRNDASLEFYSVDPSTGDKILINDSADARALKAYRHSTAPASNKPYLAEVNPRPGASGVSPLLPIEALILDDLTQVDAGSVQLSLNGAVVPASVNKVGGRTTVHYLPNATRINPLNHLRLVYRDNSLPTAVSFTNEWDFTITVNTAGQNNVKGQWDFEYCDLSATIGSPLQYLDGPNGQTATKTRFGTCSQLGVPLINNEDAKIMQVPGDLDRNLGYVMTHGIAPNGGGTRVNQYTLILDIMVNNTGPGAAALLQVNSLNNTDDGDLFWQGNNFGQGGGGYNGTSAFVPLTWHRVIAAYDEAANPPVVTKFVDGVKQDDWTANQGLDNPRRALLPTAILFGDGDQDERRIFWVNSIQIREGKLSDGEMAALGGPQASGIPQTIPPSRVTGQWNFDASVTSMNGFLAPTVGQPLQFLDGPAGQTATKTMFGTCSSFGIPLINGQDASVMRVPGDLDRNIGYVMTHGIAPNGGGSKVNQFTLTMDILVDGAGPGAASLLQINSLDNTDDGDLFWQGDNFGQGGDGYRGTGAFTVNTWHRITAAYDEAATPPVVTKYVDGIKQDDWTANQGLDAPRRALLPTAILYGDGDQDERRIMYVNSIQIRAGKLSDAEIVALGGPSAGGIPAVTSGGGVTGQWDFDQNNTFLNGHLSPTIGKALQYFDGPLGQTATKTMFGTCSSFGLPLINGLDAVVMQVPGDLDRNIGYIMEHLIPPNGGGSKVNQYTLVFDIMVNDVGPGAASLLQISSLNNTDDGDLFWQGNNFGQGADGYKGTSAFTPRAWHRVAAAYNEAAVPPRVTKFVDGIFQDDWTANQGLDEPRRALLPTAILFGDGDQDERRIMWVDSIQIRAGALSKAELAALGAPSGNGIPVVINVPQVVAPILSITRDGNTVRLSWPAGLTGYRLEYTTSLTNPVWQDVPDTAGNCATQPIVPIARFYRLAKP